VGVSRTEVALDWGECEDAKYLFGKYGIRYIEHEYAL
jgi:hypothetical protein